MSNFTSTINETIHETKITIISFLDAIKDYNTLEEFLSTHDEYIQFYSDNERDLNITLKKLNITEAEETLGWSGGGDKIKTIRYKGEFINLEYNHNLNSWLPTVRYRSVINALKQGKALFELSQK